MATAYQTRWGNTDNMASGLLLESDDPYTGAAATTLGVLPPRYHVQEVLALPPRASATDNDTFKLAIQSYGAVDVAIYADSGMASSSRSSAWNQSTSSLYYTGSSYPNHEVALVGWDDGYAASKFSTPPPGNGAFIVRNSWGSAWGIGGYFYISYYDARLSGGHVFRKPESATNYSQAYLYDPFGQTSSTGYGSATGWGANVFTASASESLRAVAINTATVNSSYEIYVYTGVTSSPATGVLEGGSVNTTGSTPYAGYHTIPLTRPVALLAGQKFAVVVKFTTPGYNYPIPLESPFSGYENATASAGQSYMSANGTTWTDVTSGYPNSNVDIRAYTGLAGAGTALTSSANPATAGQSVTFTATVSTANGAQPTGTVTFVDGSTVLCNAVALVATGSNGTAVCATTALAQGSHAISANYSGSAANPASSAKLTQTVNAPAPASTTTSLTSGTNPSTKGQAVTLTAVVSSTTATPAGSVVFKDGTATLCTATLTAGSGGKAQAACSSSALATGTHSLLASYAGNASFAASTGTLTQTVNAPKVASTLALTSSLNPSTAGQAVTFTATVSGSAGLAGGTVAFTDGNATLCPAASLANVGGKATATCTTLGLTSGNHAIAAVYGGSTAYNGASSTLAQTVNAPKLATMTVLQLATVNNASTKVQTVQLAAQVAGGSKVPTGTVAFKDGATTLCNTTVSNVGGKALASCTPPSLGAGTHTFSATYSGDSSYLGSSSVALGVTTARK